MAHKINEEECLKCGVCVSSCPEKAIIEDSVTMKDGIEIHNTRIDPDKCNDCGICEVDYFCPAQAITKA